MKKSWATAAALVTLGAVAVLTVVSVRSRSPAGPSVEPPVFHPSDVAILAATGRPQLVEFYHPG
ncbi:MAG: hypothetical protein ACKVZ0_05710 [Gemmatimonadales bacterium]